MKRILNAETLTSHGNIAGRKALLEILEAGLQAADPYNNALASMRLEGSKLVMDNPAFTLPGDPQSGPEIIDLDTVGRIFVFGAGKGVQRMAKAIEEVLGERLTGGHVIDKKGGDLILERVEVTFGAHPVPDDDCVRGCERILEMTHDLQEDDLVFTVVCNGVSSLLTLPVEGITLEEVRQTTHMMQIERGVPTADLNPIRNHIDQLKGGQLAAHIQPARAIHIVGWWLPSYQELMHKNLWLHSLPDFTTFADALNSLKKWDALDVIPPSVRAHLERANPAQETLKAKDYDNMRFRVFGLMPPQLGMVPTARKKARELGFTPYVLYENLAMQAEAAQVGRVVSNMALQTELEGNPFEPPCALIGRSELLVTVGKEQGMGGRNQEYALSGALFLADTQQVVMGAVDSDGTDGPGHQFVTGYDDVPVLAGAIVDSSTTARAAKMGLNLQAAIKQHHTSPVLYQLGDGIVATPNISMNDLNVTLILKKQDPT